MAEQVSIFRPVTKETAQDLAVYRGARKEFFDPRIRVRTQPGVTLVAAHESSPEVDAFASLGPVIYPKPDTALGILTFDVIGARYLNKGRYMTDKALALILDDPEKILEAERVEYLTRLGKTAIRGPYTPHISVLSINVSGAIEDIRKWVEDNAPSSVSVGRLSTSPHVDQPKKSELTPSPTPTPQIRSLSDRVIPQDMFEKMRPRQIPAEE